MPQLVGSDCVSCHERIRLAYEAEFCDECGNPVHTRCLWPGKLSGSELQCERCGGDRRSQVANKVKAERRAEADAVRAAEIEQHGYPKSSVCPNCRCIEYTTARTSQGVAFQHDRICAKCHTRYTPPTPLWAAVLFIVIGAAFVVAGGLELLLVAGELLTERVAPARFVGTAIVVGLAIGGVLAVRHGIRCFRNPGKQ